MPYRPLHPHETWQVIVRVLRTGVAPQCPAASRGEIYQLGYWHDGLSSKRLQFMTTFILFVKKIFFGKYSSLPAGEIDALFNQ
jgi:hypothetical protein